MTQIQQIKAEIERRMKINQWDDSEGSDVAFSEDKRLLSFIESLGKEIDASFESEYAKFSNDIDAENPLPIDLADYRDFAHHFYKFGLNASSNMPKIKGWVARDEKGTIRFGECRPERGDYEPAVGRWVGYGENIKLPHESFPELKWEDEPTEVELTINRV